MRRGVDSGLRLERRDQDGWAMGGSREGRAGDPNFSCTVPFLWHCNWYVPVCMVYTLEWSMWEPVHDCKLQLANCTSVSVCVRVLWFPESCKKGQFFLECEGVVT